MIIFFDKRDGQIFGTIDGRVHEETFAQDAAMGSSNIPQDQVGKFVVPTKPIEETVTIPITESYADPDDGFRLKKRVIGERQETQVKELTFDVSFAKLIHNHEEPTNPLQLINCKVVLDESGSVVDIIENNADTTR